METSILQSMLKRNAKAIHRQEMNVRYFKESYRGCKLDERKEHVLPLLVNAISVAKKDIKKLVAIQRAIKEEIKVNTAQTSFFKSIGEIDNWIKENNNAI